MSVPKHPKPSVTGEWVMEIMPLPARSGEQVEWRAFYLGEKFRLEDALPYVQQWLRKGRAARVRNVVTGQIIIP